MPEEKHWLAVVNEIATDVSQAAHIRGLVIRETTAAYNEGWEDARSTIRTPDVKTSTYAERAGRAKTHRWLRPMIPGLRSDLLLFAIMALFAVCIVTRTAWGAALWGVTAVVIALLRIDAQIEAGHKAGRR